MELDLALEAAQRGDYRPLVDRVNRADTCRVAQAHLHLLAPDTYASVDPSDDLPRDTRQMLAHYGSLRALLLRDRVSLKQWADWAPDSLASLWLGNALGNYEHTLARAEQWPRPSRSDSRVWLLAIRSNAALQLGRLDYALELSRRAFRIGQTDGGRVAQLAAALHLSRVRRACGQRHRAMHILRALRRAASPLWQRRIDWELTFAADPPGPELRDSLLDPAADQTLPFASDRTDADALRAALDPDVIPPPALAPYLLGAERSPPPPLAGICGSAVGASRSLLLVRPTGTRRLCTWAEHHCRALGAQLEVQGRTALAIAVLAMHETRELPRESFFSTVYGQRYDHVRHRSVLKTLAHRVRSAVEGVAECSLDEAHIKFTVSETFWLDDPTGETSLEERVLAELAAGETGRVLAISKRLGVSRRSVQNAAASLSERGMIRKEASDYVVVDTTFTEPTHWPQGERGSLGSSLD